MKWYGRNESLLDVRPDALPDYYLVMTGPKGALATSRGGTRPWLIDAVYLFDCADLITLLQGSGVKIGVATSVRSAMWDAAEIYPKQNNTMLLLSGDQRRALSLFSSAEP